MSVFRVGQAVRVVRVRNPVYLYAVGMETVIIAQIDSLSWRIEDRIHPETGTAAIFGSDLEPLTPPHIPADADFQTAFDEQFREIFAPSVPTPAGGGG